LGTIIDAITGEPFTRFIHTYQFDAAGMPRTIWGDDHDVVPNRARAYTPYVQVDGKPKRTDMLYNTYIVFPTMLRTCGGLNTTAEELARWIIASQQGHLVNKSSMETLQTARLLSDGKPGPWGIGGWVIARQKHQTGTVLGTSTATEAASEVATSVRFAFRTL
jgi:CubicO group peptidase (beta-lactamase class C family)